MTIVLFRKVPFFYWLNAIKSHRRQHSKFLGKTSTSSITIKCFSSNLLNQTFGSSSTPFSFNQADLLSHTYLFLKFPESLEEWRYFVVVIYLLKVCLSSREEKWFSCKTRKTRSELTWSFLPVCLFSELWWFVHFCWPTNFGNAKLGLNMKHVMWNFREVCC